MEITLIPARQEVLTEAEFSLIATESGEIAGQLRFPPGTSRQAIKEQVAELRESCEILKQYCIADNLQITDWSGFIFIGNLRIYQSLFSSCKQSNKASLQEATVEKLQLMSQLTEEEQASKIDFNDMEPDEDIAQVKIATEEQLRSLTLSKLKELAVAHAIPNNKSTTKKVLIPKLMGLVTTADLLANTDEDAAM